MRKLISGMMMAAGALALMAEAPAGYYTLLEGKSGSALKEAVKRVAIPDDFVSIGYGEGHTSFKTWQAFEFTDVRMIGGKAAWWDMYSNKLIYVENGHLSLNIEHSVANSWWGGESGSVQAYQDLFHLNPSNAEANVAKSNNPIGIVGSNPSYDNGLILVGAPAAGYGGGASKVFEPADEYKGDFARAYFYIMTAYDDIPWREDKGGEALYTITDGRIDLQPWTASMLLKWATEDPVDAKEMNRNEEIFKCQKNRNPFIDYPILAEYIWGNRKGNAFSLSGTEAVAVNRPADPVAHDVRITDVNTYAGSYWGECDLRFNVYDGELWISLDGASYQRYGDRISLPPATSNGVKHTVKAYAMKEVAGQSLRSSIVTVTMTAKDPSVADYSEAVWTPVVAGEKVDTDVYYLIVAADNMNVMGCTFQSNGFMLDAGFPAFRSDDTNSDITVIPEDAAIVKFSGAGNGYALEVLDIHGVSKGYWNTTAARKMRLNVSQGTSASISVEADGKAKIDFGATPGWLQYNKTNPRFLNYTSTQGAVRLYKFKGFEGGSSAVDNIQTENDAPIVIDGRNIIVPEGGMVYDLNGRCVSGKELSPGIYVVVKANGEAIKVYVR